MHVFFANEYINGLLRQLPTHVSLCLVVSVEQMVDVPVPESSSSGASERIVEQMMAVPVRRRAPSVDSERIAVQVVDVPVARSSPSRRAQVQQSTGSSAAALDASEGRKYGVFRTFSPGRKSARSMRRSTADLLRHTSSWTPAAYEDGERDWWMSPTGAFWRRYFDQEYGRYYWTRGDDSSTSQWHPPWEG